MVSLKPLAWLEAIHLIAGIEHLFHIPLLPLWANTYVLPVAITCLAVTFLIKIFRFTLRIASTICGAIQRFLLGLARGFGRMRRGLDWIAAMPERAKVTVTSWIRTLRKHGND